MFKWHEIGMAVKLRRSAWIVSACRRETGYFEITVLLGPKLWPHRRAAPLLSDQHTVTTYRTSQDQKFSFQATALDFPQNWLPAAADCRRRQDPGSFVIFSSSSFHCPYMFAQQSRGESTGEGERGVFGGKQRRAELNIPAQCEVSALWITPRLGEQLPASSISKHASLQKKWIHKSLQSKLQQQRAASVPHARPLLLHAFGISKATWEKNCMFTYICLRILALATGANAHIVIFLLH